MSWHQGGAGVVRLYFRIAVVVAVVLAAVVAMALVIPTQDRAVAEVQEPLDTIDIVVPTREKQRYLDCVNESTRENLMAIRNCKWFVYGEGEPFATPEWYEEHGRGIAKAEAEAMPPLDPLLVRCETDRDEWKDKHYACLEDVGVMYRKEMEARERGCPWKDAKSP